MLYSVLVSIDVLIAAALIGLVLLQQGKGASAGAAFGGGGGGASGTVFGARGSSSFMSRATAILAAAFFINSIVLAYLASNRPVAESVIDSAIVQEQPSGLPTTPDDLPNVIDIPEGTSPEQMMEIIKKEVNSQVGESASEIPEVTSEEIKDSVEESLPADVPQ